MALRVKYKNGSEYDFPLFYSTTILEESKLFLTSPNWFASDKKVFSLVKKIWLVLNRFEPILRTTKQQLQEYEVTGR